MILPCTRCQAIVPVPWGNHICTNPATIEFEGRFYCVKHDPAVDAVVQLWRRLVDRFKVGPGGH